MGEYSTEDLPCKITNEKDVTIDDILDEADVMWKKYRDRKVNILDTEAVEACMQEMRREHKQFCTSYPIVLRYMVQFKQYHRKALHKYLKYISVNPWKSEEEYLDSQSDYVVILYKELHPKWNRTEVIRMKREIRAILAAETKNFKDRLNEFEKKVNDTEARLKRESREELIQYFRSIGAPIDTPNITNVIISTSKDSNENSQEQLAD